MSAPSRTVMPRNLVVMGIANARSDPSKSSAVTGPNLTCVVERPLHAVVLPSTEAGGRLLELLAGALDGTGPAIVPLDPDLPPERLGGRPGGVARAGGA